MEVSGQFHVPDALCPVKEPLYSFDRRLSGLQSRSGHGEEKKKIPLRFIILLPCRIFTQLTRKEGAEVGDVFCAS
jgi:hypothetical protein